MTRIIILLLVIVGGLVAGPYFIGEKGYVLFAFENWTAEMSVISFGILMFAGLLAFLVIEWLVKRLWRGFDGSFSWFSGWSQRRRNKAFMLGMLAAEEQQYSEAQKHLSKVNHEDYSGLTLLALANSALQQQNNDQAIDYWQQAQQQQPSQLAATLHLARYYLKNNDSKQALTCLGSVTDETTLRHPKLVQLMAEALAASKQWQKLHQRLPEWKKALGKVQYQQWMAQASQGVFAEIASKQGANALKQHWQQLSRSERKDPAQQAAYIQQLIQQDMHTDAMQALVDFQSQPQALLLPLFKLQRSNNPAPAIKKLEGWLKSDVSNTTLLSTLAHVAFNAKDFSLCEKVMTKRLQLQSDREDQLLMAKTKEALGQPQAALLLYKQALHITN
ncbi:heme biosynthesis HemY N-terminal domain-containing protein [Alteromonadaceae bacterium BrNp21-10]|nr:heme biosynthesis HemY N-terminal domain-containing protein [Alteromonadaceae bacterium BrNp21-10]